MTPSLYSTYLLFLVWCPLVTINPLGAFNAENGSINEYEQLHPYASVGLQLWLWGGYKKGNICEV